MQTSKNADQAIEERYETDDREILQERSDFLLPQVVDFITAKRWINLQPEYQRRQVWDRAKQSRFVESVLMNLPIPPIFLFEVEYNRYEVMDGQQRLSSILAFYENRLRLTGLEHWKELHAKNYSDLPPKLQRGLDRRRISAVVLRTPLASTRTEEVRRIVFERLNTGGQRLNPQELRNCLYSSPFSNLLIELAGYPIFNDLCEVPRYETDWVAGRISPKLAANQLFKRMTDCEMVLRFFAFRDRRQIKGSVKSILDRCMKTNTSLEEEELPALREAFTACVDFAFDLLGKDAFKVRETDGMKSFLSLPYYDAVLVSCERTLRHRESLLRNRKRLSASLRQLISDPSTRDLISGKANTADAIKKRIDFVEQCFNNSL
jgi:hypothetical protein